MSFNCFSPELHQCLSLSPKPLLRSIIVIHVLNDRMDPFDDLEVSVNRRFLVDSVLEAYLSDAGQGSATAHSPHPTQSQCSQT